MNAQTYKTDDSFFTCLVTPGNLHRLAIFKWFENISQAKFRFIRDQEIETEYFNLQQIDDIYPGIKTIAVVTNPWRRAVQSYTDTCKFRAENRDIPATVFDFNLDNFDSFVYSLTTLPSSSKYWFTPTTPQVDWLQYKQEDNTTKEVDFILRAEKIDEDFKIIQNYFCTDTPLILKDKVVPYRKFYNQETRDIISNLAAADIKRFGYKF